MPDAHKTASEARRGLMHVISELADLATLQEVLEQRIFDRDKLIEDQGKTIEALQRKLIEVAKQPPATRSTTFVTPSEPGGSEPMAE